MVVTLPEFQIEHRCSLSNEVKYRSRLPYRNAHSKPIRVINLYYRSHRLCRPKITLVDILKKQTILRFITYYISKAFYNTKTKHGRYTSAQRENNKQDFGIERVFHCVLAGELCDFKKEINIFIEIYEYFRVPCFQGNNSNSKRIAQSGALATKQSRPSMNIKFILFSL